MLTMTCPPPPPLTAPIHCDHPETGTSYTTRRGVEGSASGSMKYDPGSRPTKLSSFMMSWAVGAGLGSFDFVDDGLDGTDVRGADVFGAIVPEPDEHAASATIRATPSSIP